MPFELLQANFVVRHVRELVIYPSLTAEVILDNLPALKVLRLQTDPRNGLHVVGSKTSSNS